MKKLKIALLLAPICLTMSSFTEAASSSAPVNVTSTSVGSQGDVFVRTDGAYADEGCTVGTRYLLPKDHAAKKELLAMLLTAQAAEKLVVISINGCGTIGAQTYGKIFNIDVQ